MAGFNSQLHPHVPAGSASGGQFAPKAASSSSKKQAAAKKQAARKGTAKGAAPSGPGKNGRYTKKQFGELQSLLKQHQAGKKLTKAQAHAEHVAHVLHMQHEKAVKAKAAPKRKTAAKVKKTGRSSIGHRS